MTDAATFETPRPKTVRGSTDIIDGSCSTEIFAAEYYIRADGSVVPTADLDMGGFRQTNGGDPMDDQDFTTKAWVLAQGGGGYTAGFAIIIAGKVISVDTTCLDYILLPAPHMHIISDTTNLQSALDGKSPIGHMHIIADTTNLQAALDGKSDTGHNHDHGVLIGLSDDDHTQYYNQARGDLRYAWRTHGHAIADTTNLQTTLDDKAPLAHMHIIANTTNLQTTLDGKADDNAVVHITGAEEITGAKNFSNSHNSFRGIHKSAVDNAGATVTFVVRTDTGTATLVFENGLLISKT